MIEVFMTFSLKGEFEFERSRKMGPPKLNSEYLNFQVILNYWVKEFWRLSDVPKDLTYLLNGLKLILNCFIGV